MSEDQYDKQMRQFLVRQRALLEAGGFGEDTLDYHAKEAYEDAKKAVEDLRSNIFLSDHDKLTIFGLLSIDVSEQALGL